MQVLFRKKKKYKRIRKILRRVNKILPANESMNLKKKSKLSITYFKKLIWNSSLRRRRN